MNPLIQLKKATPVFLVALFYFGLLPTMQAVSPAPDGGYPGGNTAEGQNALLSLTTGAGNTGVGWYSLFGVTTGSFNTGVGAGTLALNTGDQNTATGVEALLLNTTGGSNTANGAVALLNNTIGAGNVATGYEALLSNTIGSGNTATGVQALFANTGEENTATGEAALFSNTVGNFNTAIGEAALINNDTGSDNIALGGFSGNSVHTASNVICIGAGGADVSNTTWIGNVYGNATISGTTAPVIVSDTGQLGTVASSERFKKDITTMEKASEVILSLRPVTFHYKTDTTGTTQFGLIAEEVAKLNPALVLPDKEGKPYTVRYDAVNAMLLNEFLKEHHKVEEQGATIAQQRKQIEALTAGLQKVTARVEAANPVPRVVSDN
jgi:hypothetical protein